MNKMIRYSVLGLALTLVSGVPALAEGGATGAGALVGVGAGLAIGLAALGGGLGQGKLVGSALDSIGRNPSASGQMFIPMILGLALIESLVILAFVIAISLNGKI